MELVPYTPEDYTWNAGNPSKAAQGLCSLCHRPRRARWTLNIQGKAQHRAYCDLHARLWNLRRQMVDVRAAFDNPELESIVLVS